MTIVSRLVVTLALACSPTASAADFATCGEITKLSRAGEQSGISMRFALTYYSTGILVGLKMARDRLTDNLDAQKRFPTLADCVPVTELVKKSVETISIDPLNVGEFAARIARACALPENADKPMVVVSGEIIVELMAAAEERARSK